MDAFALRSFVLSLVDRLQDANGPQAPWATREEGIIMVEEILLEGRTMGLETREGFEELCKTVLAFQLRIPLSKLQRQALQRPGLSELQRIEGLRLSIVNNLQSPTRSRLPQASRN